MGARSRYLKSAVAVPKHSKKTEKYSALTFILRKPSKYVIITCCADFGKHI